MQNQPNSTYNFNEDAPTEEFVMPYGAIIPYVAPRQRVPAMLFVGIIALICSIISVITVLVYQGRVQPDSDQPLVESTTTPDVDYEGVTLLEHCESMIADLEEISVDGELISFGSPNRIDGSIIEPNFTGKISDPECVQTADGLLIVGNADNIRAAFVFAATLFDNAATATAPADIVSPTLTPEVSPTE